MNNKILVTSLFGSLLNYLFSDNIYPSSNDTQYVSLINNQYSRDSTLRSKYLAYPDQYYDTVKEPNDILNAWNAAKISNQSFKEAVIDSITMCNNWFKGQDEKQNIYRSEYTYHVRELLLQESVLSKIINKIYQAYQQDNSVIDLYTEIFMRSMIDYIVVDKTDNSIKRLSSNLQLLNIKNDEYDDIYKLETYFIVTILNMYSALPKLEQTVNAMNQCNSVFDNIKLRGLFSVNEFETNKQRVNVLAKALFNIFMNEKNADKTYKYQLKDGEFQEVYLAVIKSSNTLMQNYFDTYSKNITELELKNYCDFLFAALEKIIQDLDDGIYDIDNLKKDLNDYSTDLNERLVWVISKLPVFLKDCNFAPNDSKLKLAQQKLATYCLLKYVFEKGHEDYENTKEDLCAIVTSICKTSNADYDVMVNQAKILINAEKEEREQLLKTFSTFNDEINSNLKLRTSSKLANVASDIVAELIINNKSFLGNLNASSGKIVEGIANLLSSEYRFSNGFLYNKTSKEISYALVNKTPNLLSFTTTTYSDDNSIKALAFVLLSQEFDDLLKMSNDQSIDIEDIKKKTINEISNYYKTSEGVDVSYDELKSKLKIIGALKSA